MTEGLTRKVGSYLKGERESTEATTNSYLLMLEEILAVNNLSLQ